MPKKNQGLTTEELRAAGYKVFEFEEFEYKKFNYEKFEPHWFEFKKFAVGERSNSKCSW